MGDSALVDAVSSFTSFLIPQPAYDQYLRIPGAFPRLAPDSFLTLAAGESIDWTITTLGPYPITGKRGDPVSVGDYFLTPALLKITYRIYDTFDPTNYTDYVVAAAPSNFVWRVVEDTPVPVPVPKSTLLAPFGCGLAGLRLLRHRGSAAPSDTIQVT